MASDPIVNRRAFGALGLATLAAGSFAASPFTKKTPPIQSLAAAVSWVNSPPLTPQSLQGQVVLLDFWTYSCINCLRTLPYIRAWADKYRAHGFVVLGVHTPEFGFEHTPANVQRAASRLGINFPVAVDSNRAIWNAFGVQGWPSLFFLDAKGELRSRQVGEGNYAEAERTIQKLLREAGRTGVPTDFVAPQGEGTQAAGGPMPPSTPETYLGTSRAHGYRKVDPKSLALNEWTLAGDWKAGAEVAELQRAGGRIAYRFRARDLHLVLGAMPEGQAVRFRVRLDGQPPGADRGTDVDAEGMGTVDGHRLYQLVRQQGGARERLFEIEFLDAGAGAYAFTFG